MDSYVEDADERRREAVEEPMSLPEFVEHVFENPTAAAHASKYLLAAIEAAGTRTVVEEGERRERYRFFDDPHNDGEHAVLGNTDVLNAFVDDLRAAAADRGQEAKIQWVAGPTATGKSELKRCLINGLRAFSRTPAGHRYTVEWNLAGVDETPGLTYGGPDRERDDDWYASPVQANPLSVFPAETRRRLLDDLAAATDDPIPVRLDAGMDPFSREAYEYLEEEYRRRGRSDLFSAATGPGHLRVRNYVMAVGRGIGVLHAEDTGTPPERLVGTWMGELLREFGSRGRKNPQAFSYDGVLSQGNGGLTVVEDAAQHADLLRKLLNVPEEGTVKLDTGIPMDLDTQLVVISNPDLEAQLNQHDERRGGDPLRALKRRLDKHEFGYLTNRSLETQLLRRELTSETAVWDAETYDALAARVREPLTLPVETGSETVARELAPHAMGAAALYAVVTRLDGDDLPEGIGLVDKALLFDRGWIADGDERRDASSFAFDDDADDGADGIPVTFTRDVVARLLQTVPDRHHPDLDVSAVVTPDDVLDAMVEGLHEAPVFSPAERAEFENRVAVVKDHVAREQEADVLAAMMRDRQVAADAVSEYVEHVHAWATDGRLTNDRGESVAPDPLAMKVFETEQLGFDEGDYDGTDPGDDVRAFRESKVVTALNRHTWERRDEGFSVADVDPREVPALGAVLDASEWDDVRRAHPDFDPSQWDDPPADTATAALKEHTVENMVAHADYSRASAELASRRVVAEVRYRWD